MAHVMKPAKRSRKVGAYVHAFILRNLSKDITSKETFKTGRF